MPDMTPAPEKNPTSLKTEFARVAIVVGGMTIALAAPVYEMITKDYSLGPVLTGGAMGLGGYLFTSPIIGNRKGATLKDRFTKADRVVPALVFGVLFGALGTLMGYAGVNEEAQLQADLKVATRLQPDEIISETATEKFCTNPRGEYRLVKTPEGYDRLVTWAGQKRLIQCPK